MKNTGTFNADIILMLVFCFFLPIFLSSIMNMYFKVVDLASGKRKKSSWFDTHDPFGFPKKAAATHTYVAPPKPLRSEAATQKTPQLSREEVWNKIKEANMQKAMEGNGGARDWVTRHVFKPKSSRNKPKKPKKPNKPSNPNKPPEPQPQKNPIIEDTVEVLQSIGFTRTKAREQAESAVAGQNYESVEDLIKDIMQK